MVSSSLERKALILSSCFLKLTIVPFWILLRVISTVQYGAWMEFSNGIYVSTCHAPCDKSIPRRSSSKRERILRIRIPPKPSHGILRCDLYCCICHFLQQSKGEILYVKSVLCVLCFTRTGWGRSRAVDSSAAIDVVAGVLGGTDSGYPSASPRAGNRHGHAGVSACDAFVL